MTVTRYVLRRLAFAVLLIVALSSAAFVLTLLAPGDFAQVSDPLAPRRRTENNTTTPDRDRSIASQYVDWLGHAVRFDLGHSLAYGRPVRDLIPERALNTMQIAIPALIVATCVGLPLGIVTGTRRTMLARAVESLSLALVSIPPLITSLFLVFAASRTGWASVAGPSMPAASLADVISRMAVPVLALALPIAALFERLQAQAIAEVMAQPYIDAARARGVSWRRIVWRDGLKAAVRPIVALYGTVIGTLLSGSFIVEAVTPWPGLGLLMLDALRSRDLYLVAGCAGAGALFLAAGTLLADLALAWVDPRVVD